MSNAIVITDRVYIPVSQVDEYELKSRFLKSVYAEEKCAPCPYRPDRHSEVCDTCPGFLGNFKLYNEKEVKGVEYYGLSIGNRKDIKQVVPNLKKLKIKDKRAAPKFRYKIKFTGKLHDYQEGPCNALLAKGYGILDAPPRSGKTVMLTQLFCKMGLKVLILASQYDYLTQFYETICGSDSQKALTNVRDIEEFEGKKICGIVEKMEDFDRYDIALATYQQFITKKGKKRLDKIKRNFGLLLIDEVDQTPATCFSRVVNAFHAKHRIGCTGTTERKDGMHFILEHIIGPVTAKAEVESLTPNVEFIETGVSTTYDYKVLAYAYRFLAQEKKRNDLIVDWVMHDLKQGRSIVIPVMTVDHVKLLTKMINDRAGSKVAVGFTASLMKSKDHRKKVIMDARKYKTKVIIGIRRMVQRGINVPRWDTLYEVMPISNPPNFRQETARILTPVPGKPEPVIRFFLDDFGFSKGCLRNCLFGKPGITSMKFRVSKENWAAANKYVKKGSVLKISKRMPGGTISATAPRKKVGRF